MQKSIIKEIQKKHIFASKKLQSRVHIYHYHHHILFALFTQYKKFIYSGYG